MNDALADIHAAFLDILYPMVFGILLGDRGTDFSDPETLESFAKNGKVFYCDPGKPGQKGGIERNHVEMFAKWSEISDEGFYGEPNR